MSRGFHQKYHDYRELFCSKVYQKVLEYIVISKNQVKAYRTMRVSKIPFRVVDKLKSEIQKFMIRFLHQYENRDCYFYVKIDIYFEFLIIRAPKGPFSFHFKIGMEKDNFVYFNFISKLKNEKGNFFFNF